MWTFRVHPYSLSTLGWDCWETVHVVAPSFPDFYGFLDPSSVSILFCANDLSGSHRKSGSNTMNRDEGQYFLSHIFDELLKSPGRKSTGNSKPTTKRLSGAEVTVSSQCWQRVQTYSKRPHTVSIFFGSVRGKLLIWIDIEYIRTKQNIKRQGVITYPISLSDIRKTYPRSVSDFRRHVFDIKNLPCNMFVC